MTLVFLFGLGLIFGTVAMEDLKGEVKRNSESLKVLTKRLDRITLDLYSFESRLEVKLQTMFDEWKSAIANKQAPYMETTHEVELTKNVKTMLENTVQKQTAIVHRTLVVEKRQMRTLKSEIQSELMNFEANTSNTLRAINESLERSLQLSEKVQKETDKYKLEVKSNFAKIHSEMRVHNDTVKSSISSITSKISSNTNSISSLSRRVSSSANEISQLSSRVSSNTNNISSQSIRISDLYSKRGDFSAFTAQLRKELSNYPKNKRIVFNAVHSNLGHDFSSSTGIYTAPVNGYYLFLFNVQCQQNKKAHVYLMHEGNYVVDALAYCEDGKSNETGGSAGVLHLNKGDQVWVQTADLEESFYDIYSWRTTFSGTLLHAD